MKKFVPFIVLSLFVILLLSLCGGLRQLAWNLL